MVWRTKPAALEEHVVRIRRFDRFYERRLREHRNYDTLATELTTAEIRVLQELGDATPQWGTPAWLSGRTGLDPGYLCRILSRFREQGIVSVGEFSDDRRLREVVLTDWGRWVYRGVEDLQSSRRRDLLEGLPERQQRRLVHAMEVIEELLARNPLDHLLEKFGIKGSFHPG